MTDAARAARLAAYFDIVKLKPHWFETPQDGLRIVLNPERIAEIEAEMGQRYVARGQPAVWAEVGLHYQDPYLLVLRDAVIFPDGSAGIHHRTMRLENEPAGVAILPVIDGKILLLWHYRHPTRAWSWEMPRGAVEPGETFESTVRTELREEIEGEVGEITDLGLLYGASGFMGLGVRLFIAKLMAFGAPALGEGIAKAKLFTIAEVEDMIRNSEITDSFTLAGFLHARLRGLV